MHRILPVTTQWALWGRKAQGAGYGLHAFSSGAVDGQALRHVLGRYSPGTLTVLPQVTIGWFQSGEDGTEGRHFITLNIHDEHELPEGDNHQVVLTRLFCVPFDQLAAGSVSYTAMYHGLRELRLPTPDREPLSVPLRASTWQDETTDRTADADDMNHLAQRVAALLLTTKPVCILGAERATMEERLEFIDAVASWLPYGMRSTLSASTWTSSNARTHKIRLFFSAAERGERDHGERDYVVTWNRPDSLPKADGFALRYLNVLRGRVLTPAHLAEEKTPAGFDDRDIAWMIRRLESPRSEGRKRQTRRPAPDGADQPRDFEPTTTSALIPGDLQETPAAQAQPPAPESAEQSVGALLERQPGASPRWRARAVAASAPAEPDVNADELLEIFYSCAVALTEGNPTLLRRAIAILHAPRERAHWENYPIMDLVEQHQLLPQPTAHIDQELLCEFYTTLLKLAFNQTMTYQGYCRVEKCAGYQPGQRLHPTLARAMLQAGLQGPARLLVRDSLSHADRQLALRDFPIAPYESVAMLIADPPPGPAHARVIFHHAVQNMDVWQYDKHDQLQFEEAMNHHKLLWALQKRYSGDPQFQYDQLTWALRSAYDELDRHIVRDIFRENPGTPPASLLGAMLAVVKPKDVTTVLRIFALATLRRTPFTEQTHQELGQIVATSTSARRKFTLIIIIGVLALSIFAIVYIL